MVDAVIAEKIDSINRCISRIEEKKPQTLEKLRHDIDAQDIICLNLERAIQQCVDIAMILLSKKNLPLPATMREGFEALAEAGILTQDIADRMIKAVGVRNILVHTYTKINWEIIWVILTDHLDDFRAFARAVD